MRRYLCLLALAAAACADPDAPTPASDVTDVSDVSDVADAVGDADVAADAEDAALDTEASPDALPEDVLDASPDVAPDASPDAPADVAPDRGPRCEAATCNNHGRCDDAAGAPVCACDAGYAGARCDACAAGAFPDGRGGCTTTPCEPNPCTAVDRARCTVGPMGAVCNCNSGTHEEAGRCVPDVACTATSCNGHGACSVDATGIRCACAAGYAGARCDGCAPTYHPDGTGGCTADPCRPSPCTAANRSVCVADGVSARCDCDRGYHLDGDRCAADEVCAAATCNGHGACSVTAGRAACVCAVGYAGARCDACAAGYHADGTGGCTGDPCLPNPCTTARRTVCVAMGAAAVCNCEAGYHLDGMGGCTNDPCLPDPCAARNLACRAAMGAAECYAPPCNDGNPCTDDALVMGRCTHSPRADGSACATDACTTGQRCAAGSCAGGTALRCDDGNPCTRDRCDPTTGCAAANDDALVPDDGVACTVDRCAAGRASHVATDAVCDDGRYCTGVERCTPGGAGADARGCVATMVPAAPAPDGACVTYVCDETTRTFVATTRAGMRCDDTIACTAGDACNADGACVGAYVAGCSAGGACGATTPLGAGINLLTARVRGTVTLNGAALPRTLTPAQVPSSNVSNLYLVAQDTGARHTIGYVYYPSGTTSYALVTNGDRVDANVPPGVYDLLFNHNVYTSSPTTASRQPTDPFPSGERLLRTNVVIGPGTNALNVDIPTTRVTGSITLGGAALPRTLTPAQVPSSNVSNLYLVARDTGARHTIGYVYYPSGTTSYALVTNGDRVDANIPPGVYDLLFNHNVYTSSPTTASKQPTDPFPSGERILRSAINVTGSAFTLDVDIPAARVTGTITLDGAALPRTLLPAQVPSSNVSNLYLVAQDTGARHTIGYVYYPSGTTSYALVTNGDRVDANIPPGTYDLLLNHNVYTSSPTTASRQPTDPFPSGERLLRTSVVIPPGASTLNVDIPTARVTGTVTLNGAALPRTLTSAQVPSSNVSNLYLVARDTGARHTIGYVYYPSGTTSYALVTNGDRIDANIPPGTYDLLFNHNIYTSSPTTASRQPTDPFPSGERVLRSGVVIAAGANTLNVDIVTSRVTGAITLAGAALPRTLTPAQVPSSNVSNLYLVARDTGARHTIGYVYYPSGSTSYALVTNGDRIDANIPPGTYDLLFNHNIYTSSPTTASRQPTDPFPSGERILRSAINVTGGAFTLDVDIPATRVTGTITLDGAALPRTLTPAQVPSSNVSNLYLVARDTGARHTIGYVYYPSGSTSYALVTNGDRFDANVLPGIYDLLLNHNVYTSSPTTASRQPTDPFPSGERLLRACVSVP
ncbi:MAG: hypothetical protein U0324_19950 [Polyangiales bacterium]